MNVEEQLISKLLVENDWETIDKFQIRGKLFSGKYTRQFSFIKDFVAKYGKVPSFAEFKKRFPDFKEVSSLEEPLSYYCDALREKKKHNTIVDMMENAQEQLNLLETEKAYTILKKTVLEIENEIILGDTKKLNEDTQKRWEKYKNRAESGGLTGLPTGIEPFDTITGGLGATDLVTILGYTNVGKTWKLIIMGVNLAKAGKKVLFVTREMSTEQVEKRTDSVYSGVSYTRFNRGNMTEAEEEQFKEYLAEMEGNEEVNFIIELSTGGVSNISALVDKHKPDVLLIDGGYLMTDDSDEKDWNGILETWRGFKSIALNRKIPVVVTMQLKASKATLDNIALAKYISQDCDVIIGMEQDEVMRADKECKFKPLKLRDSDTFATYVLNWDFNKMDYSTRYVEGDVPAKGLVKTLENKDKKGKASISVVTPLKKIKKVGKAS
jgi:replicative DNA helicase